MRISTKIAIVLAGYAGAAAAALGVVWVHVLMTSGPDRNASSGMYAFGDLLFFLFAFGAFAIPATGAAMYFLRPYRWFWKTLALGALLVAATGAGATIVFFAGRMETAAILGKLAPLSVLRILSAPLWALLFGLSGIFAPERPFRRALFAASFVEVAALVPVVIFWARPFMTRY